MGKSEHAHCQAALRAECMMVIQLSKQPALLAKVGAPSPFYLEWQQWEASQCTAVQYMENLVPQWESYILGSARYSIKDFSGLFLRCMDVLGIRLKKYLKGMQKWMTGLDATDRRYQSCLHLGLTTPWCFIIVLRLVVRPIAVWSHSCSDHDLMLTWWPSLNWTGPNCGL